MIGAGANPLIRHAWGISPAEDRVWSQVSGIAPSSKPWERLFVVLQAFIDESYDAGVFVLAGYVASAESWAYFSKEWEELLLLYGVRSRSGNVAFKMSAIANHPEKVSAFYHIIEKYAIMGLSCRLDLQDFDRAKRSISPSPSIDIRWDITPYHMTYRALLDLFHRFRHEYRSHPIISGLITDQPIDFYFDDHSSKNGILAAWDNYINSREAGIKELYGATPRFENDEKFLPLQAADFLAWWIRRAYTSATINNVQECSIPEWNATRLLPNAHIWLTEDHMSDTFIKWVREKIGPASPIYRMRLYFNGERL